MGSAQAASARVERGSGFLHVRSLDGNAGCLRTEAGEEQLAQNVEEILEQEALDPDFAILLSARVLTCPHIYYLPRQNEVTGIGYRHHFDPEIFDRNPRTRLSGIVFLNDFPYYRENAEEFRNAFLHEMGHRFLAMVHAERDENSLDLLGRDQKHWSFFLDTDGSPLEGNDWQEREQAFQVKASPSKSYSMLDLYLMGAADPDEVPPQILLAPREPLSALDCSGEPLSESSPPQDCSALSLDADRNEFSVEDVIAAEGPRNPRRADAPQEFSVVLLLLDPDGDLEAAACRDLGASFQERLEDFEQATLGRMSLRSLVPLDAAYCGELRRASAQPSCHVEEVRASTTKAAPILSLVCLLAAFGRRRTRLPVGVRPSPASRRRKS